LGYRTPEHPEAIRRPAPWAIPRKSFTYIRELCGESSPRYYDHKQRLSGAATPAELEAAGEALAAALDSLAEHEQRKLKLVLSRRWKLV
jgi:hypothetical protein